MKIFVYPSEDLLFEWPYFEECTKVQDLFLSELKTCEFIEDADLAFFPLMLGSAFQHQKSTHAVLSKKPNLQYEWRTKWSKLIKNDDKVKHFILLSYVLFNTNLSFIPSHFTILCYEIEATQDIHGTIGNFGCRDRIMTIPYFVNTTNFQMDLTQQKSITMCFIGSFAHASKYRKPIVDFLKPDIFEPSAITNYLEIYSKSKLSLVLRGDTPTRCAFYQSLLANCCPIIFKHCFLHYKNLYNGILPIEDLCLVIPDYDFNLQQLTNEYKQEIFYLISDFLANKFDFFTKSIMKYKHFLDYNLKKCGLSSPLYYSLKSMQLQRKLKTKTPIAFIANLDPSFNLKCLPTKISSRDMVIGKETSQYELEIHWYKQIQNNYIQTSVIERADFVFIPFYTFLSGWKDGDFNNDHIITKLTHLIEFLPSWQQKLNIPHILVYSDVCWPENSFIDRITNWPSNTILVSLESIEHPIIKTFTSPYLHGVIPNDEISHRSLDLLYIGRMRYPFVMTDVQKQYDNCKFMFIEMEGWKSINEADFISQCNSLYTNSVFSLQPPGDRETRRGFFQSLVCGCIPVIFKDNVNGYQQHTKRNIKDLCIIIPLEVKDASVSYVLDYLSFISKERIATYRKNILEERENYLFKTYNSKPVSNLIDQILQTKKKKMK